MRSWLPVLLAAVLIAIGGASALAVPSLGGPTGLVLLPTADIAPVDEWQTAFGHRSVALMYGIDDLEVTLWQLGFVKGVADDAEIWVTYQRATNGEDTDVWRLGGKYEIGNKLMPRSGFFADTRISIGGSLGRYRDDVLTPAHFVGLTIPREMTDTKTLDFYLVVTKQFVPPDAGEWEWEQAPGTRIIGTLGLYYLNADFDDYEGQSLFEPFAGVAFVSPKGLVLAFEYRAKASDLEDEALVSYLLRYPVDRHTAIEVGLTNGSPIGLGQTDQDLFARLTYSIPVAAY